MRMPPAADQQGQPVHPMFARSVPLTLEETHNFYALLHDFISRGFAHLPGAQPDMSPFLAISEAGCSEPKFENYGQTLRFIFSCVISNLESAGGRVDFDLFDKLSAIIEDPENQMALSEARRLLKELQELASKMESKDGTTSLSDLRKFISAHPDNVRFQGAAQAYIRQYAMARAQEILLGKEGDVSMATEDEMKALQQALLAK